MPLTDHGERPQRELNPVRLRLVATEDQDRPVRGTRGRRREEVDIDGIWEDLPRHRGLAEEEVARLLRELALVEHVRRGPKHPAQRPVDLLRSVACPAGVADAVLVRDDGNMSVPREREELAEVLREPGRPEVEDREVRGTVRKAGVELLHLHGAARGALSGRRYTVVTVEDADPRTPSHGEQPRPPDVRAPVAGRSRSGQVHSDGASV